MQLSIMAILVILFIYVDVDADTNITASDAAFILQKTLVSTFELLAEKKYK